MAGSPTTSIKVYWQVSARPCGTFSAAQRYCLQATNVSEKKAATAVTKIAAKTRPHMHVSLDSQVLRDSQILREPWVSTSNIKVAHQSSMTKVLRLIEVSL